MSAGWTVRPAQGDLLLMVMEMRLQLRRRAAHLNSHCLKTVRRQGFGDQERRKLRYNSLIRLDYRCSWIRYVDTALIKSFFN